MVGAIRFLSNAELDAAKASSEAVSKANDLPHITALAKHVLNCWEEARRAKALITPRILAAQRARMGQYEPDVLAEITKFGGSQEYARITANKCRIAESWLRDVFIGQTEKPWTLTPTPVPDLPDEVIKNVKAQVSAEFATQFAKTGVPASPEIVAAREAELQDAELQRIQESARESAARMERVINDQLMQGGWVTAMGEFLSDMVTFPAAHLKAPVIRKRPQLKWSSNGGVWMPVVEESVVPEFERVDPLRCYPAPGATSPQEGYFIEHISLSRSDLYSMIGVEGFDEAAIREVLDEYGRGGLVDWITHSDYSARSVINGELYPASSSNNVTIDALEYHGPVQGRQLIEWGLPSDEIEDPAADYEAQVWLVGRWVIKAQLNADPLKRRPYYKTSYEEVPGAYWGLGLVDILADVQGVANAALRALVNNMALGSGPQIGVNVDRLPPGEDLTNIHPLRIWQFGESQTGSNSKAIEFFQPESNVAETLAVIEKAYQLADDFSLIPRYMSGAPAGGAGRTASGLSMLMEAANKGLKGVVSNIDVKIITPMLEAMFNYNMLYNKDQSIKGDVQIVARGAMSLMQLEALQLRRNEFLLATNNPVDNQITGLDGRAEVLREVAKGLQMDVNRIIPQRGALQNQNPAQSEPQPAMRSSGMSIGSGQELLNGAPVVDNFSKNGLTPV